MSRSPFRFKTDELNELKNKKVKIVTDMPVKIIGSHIESNVLVGYFDSIGTNADPPHFPLYIYFIHEIINEWPEVTITDSQKTIIELANVATIELER